MELQSVGTLGRRETHQRRAEEQVYPVGAYLYVPGASPGAGTLDKPVSPATAMLSYNQLVQLVRATPVLSFASDENVDAVIALQQGGSVSVEASPVQGALRFLMPSQDNFEYLAHYDAPRLLRWIVSGDLSDATLTFAAEAAGFIANSVAVLGVLVPLLKHDSPPVREGAVYGLQRHLHEPQAREALKRVAAGDASLGVREAAQEALDQLDED